MFVLGRATLCMPDLDSCRTEIVMHPTTPQAMRKETKLEWEHMDPEIQVLVAMVFSIETDRLAWPVDKLKC